MEALLLAQCSSHLLIILISHLCPHSFHSFRLYHAYTSKIVSVLLGTLGQFKAVNVMFRDHLLGVRRTPTEFGLAFN